MELRAVKVKVSHSISASSNLSGGIDRFKDRNDTDKSEEISSFDDITADSMDVLPGILVCR
jgi:hypothetical protein